jgi:uncharacterized protein YbaR (Trm112 family)
MISQDFLEMLRCPLDPAHTRLDQTPEGLVCQRCRLRFPVKDGIPCMLVEEARLPPGCESVSALPCQQPARAPGSREATA